MCAFYSSRESVSGILDNPATKWDRAGGTGRQLVSIQAAGFQIEEPAGARDLPQFNTQSEHNTHLSDVITRVRRAAVPQPEA